MKSGYKLDTCRVITQAFLLLNIYIVSLLYIFTSNSCSTVLVPHLVEVLWPVCAYMYIHWRRTALEVCESNTETDCCSWTYLPNLLRLAKGVGLVDRMECIMVRWMCGIHLNDSPFSRKEPPPNPFFLLMTRKFMTLVILWTFQRFRVVSQRALGILLNGCDPANLSWTRTRPCWSYALQPSISISYLQLRSL